MSSFAGDCEQPDHSDHVTQKEADAGILPSHGKELFHFSTFDDNYQQSLSTVYANLPIT